MTNKISLDMGTRFFVGVGLLLATLVVISIPAFTHAATLDRQLQVGMSGADVSALQAFLAKDATLYPQGLVTGYFGFLTKAAVANFQSRNGIASVGRVGPTTLPVLNFQMAAGMGSSSTAPVISGVGVTTSSNGATVSWNTNESAQGLVYYSATPLSTFENANSVNVSGNTAMTDTGFRTSQNVSLSGLSSNTLYYYLIYTTDQGGDVSVTWPAVFRTQN